MRPSLLFSGIFVDRAVHSWYDEGGFRKRITSNQRRMIHQSPQRRAAGLAILRQKGIMPKGGRGCLSICLGRRANRSATVIGQSCPAER